MLLLFVYHFRNQSCETFRRASFVAALQRCKTLRKDTHEFQGDLYVWFRKFTRDSSVFHTQGSLTQQRSWGTPNYETLSRPLKINIVAISKSGNDTHALSLSRVGVPVTQTCLRPCFALSTHLCNRLTASDILYCPRSKESRVSMNCQHLISVSSLTKEYTAESFFNSMLLSLAFSSHSFNSSAINRCTCKWVYNKQSSYGTTLTLWPLTCIRAKETMVLRRWEYYKIIWFYQLSW